MSIKQAIEKLQAIAADPKSGLTLESPVFIEGLETEPAEEAADIYAWTNNEGRRVAMFSAIAEFAKTESR